MAILGIPSAYLRNIATVLSGTMAAQSIPLLAMLLIARLISPEELGLFSIWLSLVIILSIVATGCLEVLLVTVKDRNDKAICLRIASLLCLGVSCATVLVSIAADGWLEESITGWNMEISAAVGIAVWASGMSDMWISAAVSRGDFRKVNAIRIVTAATVAAVQIGLSLAGLQHGALVWGYVIGTVAGAILGQWTLAPFFSPAQGKVTLGEMRQFLTRNYRIPLFALPALLLNTVAQQAPVLIAGAAFGPQMAGYLALAIRTLVAPVTIFSSSVQHVFRHRATEDYHLLGNCRVVYLESLKILVLVGAIPSLALLFAAPALFSLVYGSPWRDAGAIAQILAPMLFLRFFASPLSYTLLIANRAHIELYWQIALVLMTLAAFLLPAEMTNAVVAYSAGYSFLYVVYACLSYRASLGNGTGAVPHPSTSDVH